MWHWDVLATFSVMYVIRTVHDVASTWFEVDVGRFLVEVGRRCHPLLVYSKRLMRYRMMSFGTDVVLHEIAMFSMMCSKVLLQMFPWCGRWCADCIPWQRILLWKEADVVSMSSTDVEDGRGLMTQRVSMIRRCCSRVKESMSTSP